MLHAKQPSPNPSPPSNNCVFGLFLQIPLTLVLHTLITYSPTLLLSSIPQPYISNLLLNHSPEPLLLNPYSSTLLLIPTSQPYSSTLLLNPTPKLYSSTLLLNPPPQSYSSTLLLNPTPRSNFSTHPLPVHNIKSYVFLHVTRNAALPYPLPSLQQMCFFWSVPTNSPYLSSTYIDNLLPNLTPQLYSSNLNL